MNNELYKMLTLNRVRGFAKKDELHFSADDLGTILTWLHDLDGEIHELQAQIRLAWWEKQ